MTKRIIAVFFLCAFLLTGCWDQRELSTITVITGMAVDKGKNGKYKLSCEGINAQELNAKTSSGYSPALVLSLEGNTISELTQKMSIQGSRNLVYSHMRTLIISEEVARKGMMDFLDYLERNREIRDDFNILISRNVKAADVLRVSYPFQKSTSLKLFSQLETMVKNWGGDPNVRLKDVINAWRSDGRQPIMAAVKIQGDPKKGINVDNMKKLTPDALVVLDSLAVFKKSKLLGFLSITDSRNYLWVEDNLVRTAMSVPCGKNRYIAVQFYNSKTRTKSQIVFGRPEIHVNIRAESYLDGTQCLDDLSKVATYKKYEKMVERKVRDEVQKTIRMTQQKYHVDIFGFGELAMRQDYQDFKKIKNHWDESFTDAKVSVHVKVNLRRSGIRTRTLLKS